jgi:hypothetical protein
LKKTILTTSAAALAAIQPASASAQFLPRLNICHSDENSEGWRVVASDDYYEIYPSILASSGNVSRPIFSIRYRDTGAVRYSLQLRRTDVLTRYENHYIYADGELLLTAGNNARANGNTRGVGVLPANVFEAMKSAERVEIRVTRSFTGEPDRPRGSVTLDLRPLPWLEPVGRSRMERLHEDKQAGRCN